MTQRIITAPVQAQHLTGMSRDIVDALREGLEVCVSCKSEAHANQVYDALVPTLEKRIYVEASMRIKRTIFTTNGKGDRLSIRVTCPKRAT